MGHAKLHRVMEGPGPGHVRPVLLHGSTIAEEQHRDGDEPRLRDVVQRLPPDEVRLGGVGFLLQKELRDRHVA